MTVTEKQKCINEYFANVKKIQQTFGIDINELPKYERKHIRFKFACVNAHPDCIEIPKHKKTSDFEACQIKCKYSYDYNPTRTL